MTRRPNRTMLPQLQQRLGRMTSAGKAALLLSSAALLWLIGTSIGWCIQGSPAFVLSSVGLVICLFGGLSAILVVEFLPDDDMAWARVLAGMLLRMGIPLGMLVVIHLGAPNLTQSGLPFYLLVYYMPLLALETIMSLPATQPATLREDC